MPDDFGNYNASLNGTYGKQDSEQVSTDDPHAVDFTRTGEDHRQAMLRAYLPAYAGHNLVMGTELALFEQPGAAGTVAAKNPAAGQAEPARPRP